ncbi:MAG: 50S ribosomal protein L29 [Flavobacteriaceae bacterium]|jgi:large subunit ribosomal protein L29|nr:50S ribosomal protein L29 [Flavobacteriaceae bacterium]MAQ60314.1 50S ribosomal protein L29 [Flavobacteriaceae bacterium]GIR98987.1 MAG: 50S ribosomal protein L29 [Flavobacteriaceae bacterium]|tara:strand:+ start:181 stop:372 length:192 start_codon:yes stop_codon:yes gene_type:complete
MKQSEIKILTDDELVDKLESLIKSQEDTKLTHVVSPIENPLVIRKNRRTIARMKTELAKRKSS